jgi:hypothetical protein
MAMAGRAGEADHYSWFAAGLTNLASFPAQLGFAVAQSTVARHRYLKHAVNVFFT